MASGDLGETGDGVKTLLASEYSVKEETRRLCERRAAKGTGARGCRCLDSAMGGCCPGCGVGAMLWEAVAPAPASRTLDIPSPPDG